MIKIDLSVYIILFKKLGKNADIQQENYGTLVKCEYTRSL